MVQWSDWFSRIIDKAAPARYSMRFDRAHMSLDAAAQGLGVALESSSIGGRHLAEGKLSAMFGLDKAAQVKAHAKRGPGGGASRVAA